MHIDREALSLERDQPVDEDFPVLVAGEIIVGEKKSVDPEFCVGADDRFEIVGRAEAALAALDIDDGAERTFERTSAPEVEAGMPRDILGDLALVQQRDRLTGQIRSVGEMIVDRL